MKYRLLNNIIKITAALILYTSVYSFANASSHVDNKEYKPDVSKGEAIYTKGIGEKNIPACISCHGNMGNSGGGANPKLAAQHSAYIYKQLQNFGEKDKTQLQRNNAIMSGIASNLSKSEMQDIAAYLEKQTIKLGATKTKDGLELGKKIYRGGIASKDVPACAACHGPSGSGLPSQYPRIGGQWSDYTKAQLIAFKSGVRANNVVMTSIASRLSDKEIAAVADYVSGLH
jgi:cytochrome c553